jgi:feruloyl esterase
MKRKSMVYGGVGAVALLLGAAGCGNDDDNTASTPPPAARAMTADACTALQTGSFANSPAQVTATWVTDRKPTTTADTLPAYCEVNGTINPRTGTDGVAYGIKFQLTLPANWNGRFFFQGGGGTDGSVSPAYGTINSADGGNNVALRQGYAVVSTDGGHENSVLAAASLPTSGFGAENQARIDWGYNAIDKTATTAKSMIQTAYGTAPQHSYFLGCSNGGRQGMMFTQRFPDYFDGVVAGDPVMDLGSITAAEMWGMQQVASVSPVDGATGKVLYDQGFSQADRALYTQAYLQACDTADGAADGMVQNPKACTFNPAQLLCTGAKDATCLSAGQVKALADIVAGPVNSTGAPVKVPGYVQVGETQVAGYPLDAGWMSPAGQPSRVMGTTPGDIALGGAQIPYLHITPADPTFVSVDPNTLKVAINWDTYPGRMTVNAPWLSTKTDISAFKAHSGKMIFYHGLADPGPSVANTIGYYDRLALANGGVAQTQAFARLFLIPGMGHCSGGPATDSFDQLKAIVDWVENGIAPDSMVATARSNNTALAAVTPAIPAGRTRPLCAYPKTAVYSGSGDVNKAESFMCQ